MRTRTYYRGPDAVVTSEVFVWRTAPAQIFAIRALRNVGIVRCRADGGRPHTAHAAAGSAALALAVWPVLDTPALVAVVILVVAVPGVAAATYRRRRRLWEIHALHRGAEVILYASTDVRIFNQVARALRRAIEDAGPHASVNGEAVA